MAEREEDGPLEAGEDQTTGYDATGAGMAGHDRPEDEQPSGRSSDVPPPTEGSVYDEDHQAPPA